MKIKIHEPQFVEDIGVLVEYFFGYHLETQTDACYPICFSL